MDITSSEFVKGIIGTDKILYNGKAQVAFFGRSNVGKSSLINSLLGRNKLARTSANPGRTVRIDFFLINNKFYFVDFPGYGYARRAPAERDKLAKMVLWYVQYSDVTHRIAILVLDAQIGVTDFDTEMLKILRESNVPHVVVANKMDKLTQNEKQKQLASIAGATGGAEVYPYSSKTKLGRRELLAKISAFVEPRKTARYSRL